MSEFTWVMCPALANTRSIIERYQHFWKEKATHQVELTSTALHASRSLHLSPAASDASKPATACCGSQFMSVFLMKLFIHMHKLEIRLNILYLLLRFLTDTWMTTSCGCALVSFTYLNHQKHHQQNTFKNMSFQAKQCNFQSA